MYALEIQTKDKTKVHSSCCNRPTLSMAPWYLLIVFHVSEEEEDDDDEYSEEDTGDLVLQSSSLSAVDDEKEVMEPPVKQPRTNLSLHTLNETDSTPP